MTFPKPCTVLQYPSIVLAVTLALHCVPSSGFSPGSIAVLRPSVQSSCCGRGPPRKTSVTTLRAEAGTEKKKFRGPGNPAAAALQTSTFGDDLIDDVLNKRFGAGQAFYGVKQSAEDKDYDAIADEAKDFLAMREVRQDATLIIGACRGVGGVASWSVIKAMQKDVPIRILASDFKQAELAFGTDGANLDIFVGDTTDDDELDNACDGVKTVVYADEGSFPFGANSYETRSKTGLERLLQVAARYPLIQRIVYVSSGVQKGLRGGASQAMWSAEDLLRASGIPYVILRPTTMLQVPGGASKVEVASSYAAQMPAGTTTTAMDVADALVTCLVMDEILAKAKARGGALPNLPLVKDQLTFDVWNNDFETAPADAFTVLVKALATLPADGQ